MILDGVRRLCLATSVRLHGTSPWHLLAGVVVGGSDERETPRDKPVASPAGVVLESSDERETPRDKPVASAERELLGLFVAEELEYRGVSGDGGGVEGGAEGEAVFTALQ